MQDMTATEILMRNKEVVARLDAHMDAAVDPIISRMFDLMVRYGCVTTCIAPLRWWERVLLWNPCNDFVHCSGPFSIKIVT